MPPWAFTTCVQPGRSASLRCCSSCSFAEAIDGATAPLPRGGECRDRPPPSGIPTEVRERKTPQAPARNSPLESAAKTVPFREGRPAGRRRCTVSNAFWSRRFLSTSSGMPDRDSSHWAKNLSSSASGAGQGREDPVAAGPQAEVSGELPKRSVAHPPG